MIIQKIHSCYISVLICSGLLHSVTTIRQKDNEVIHLIHTVLTEANDGVLTKYEIYSNNRKVDIYGKVPEKTCRVIYSRLNKGEQVFKIIDSDVNLHILFENNKSHSESWFSDGPDKVNLEMVIDYLTNNR